MINLYYDNITVGNGSNLSNDPAVQPTLRIPEHLTLSGIPFEIKDISTTLQS
jgi:hypothetical protein